MALPRPVRLLLRLGTTLIVGYAGLVTLVALAQRKLLYHPSRAPYGALEREARSEKFAPWLDGHGQPIGWTRPSPHPRGTNTNVVLVIHGNAGLALHRVHYADSLQQAADVDVYLLEYPGFGFRDGDSDEASFYAAAEDGLRQLPADARVFVVGESLGTGVACHLAGTHPDRIAGLLLVAPYDRLVNVAQYHFPLLPVRWILRDRFPAAEHLSRYHGPVFVWLGQNDTIIPARFSRALHQGYAGRKLLREAPGAGHMDVGEEGPAWWAEVVKFWGIGGTPSPWQVAPR